MSILNLFDSTFFKFVIGFTAILSLSFAVLFFVGKYTSVPDSVDTTAQVNVVR
ncbi:MAG: hypothetical protein HZA80_01325 [Candidatus Taylorbacteria bacterium]|nr:hypothetical protein [Candidatus Taylorbacteria bacterium]